MKTKHIPAIPPLLFAAVLATLSSADAQSTWNGGSTVDNNWTTGANWGGTAPAAGSNLIFAGTTRPGPFNNYTGGTVFGNITFAAGAGAFTLTGNSIAAASTATPIAITNNSSNLQTINLAVSVAATRTYTTNGSGGDITVGALASGSVVKLGAGTLTFGASGYGGTTTIGSLNGADAGTLRFTGNKTASGAITVNAGTLDLNGRTAAINTGGVGLTLGGGATGTSANLAIGTGGTFTITSGSVSTLASTLASTITGGTLSMGGAARTFSVVDGGAAIDLEVSSIITTGSLTKSGAGTMRLTNANTYTGVTRVTGGGTLEFSTVADGNFASSLGASSNAAGNLQILNGSGISYIGGNASTDRLFQVGETTNADIITVSANGSGAINFTNNGLLTYGTIDQTRTLVLLGSNTGSNTLSAKIDNNGIGAIAVAKSGTGTWVLAGGSNTYTGATTVDQGTLLINGSTASGSAVTINSGGTLGGIGTIAGSVATTGIGRLTGGSAGTGAADAAANVGTLSTGALTLASTSTLLIDIGTASSFDKINLTGTANLGGATLSLNIATGLTFSSPLTIIENDDSDAFTGTFASLSEGATLNTSGYSFTVSYVGGIGGNDFTLTAVPEPSTWVGAGLVTSLAVWSQRKRLASLTSKNTVV